MMIKELVQRMEITDIVCDICGQSCKSKNGSPEFVAIDTMWGYYSNKDGVRSECDICELCFDKVKDFIENTLKGKVRETSSL